MKVSENNFLDQEEVTITSAISIASFEKSNARLAVKIF